ncbi:MAG TPA: ABC transporter substrate-binding protein [Methylophaga aminisulfidivorans]|jgi:phospholipid transport system substrate-binding protein|nr:MULTISPECIES: ABC transporter substrate-binding protein [Methylophaga]WVI85124.1 ABC transporter substrate-binding protein [Methylophaga thalassica]HIC45237.1 ABC transporter substrate-binding protein [Methylophaga sp.]HIM38536.1 ABC transporter substrate-binding protein [Methylophaga aminisulfidivorans]
MISKYILSLMAGFFLATSLTVSADSMPVPQALVKNASDEMLKALKDNKAELNHNPDKIYSLVEQILMPYFDFEKMSKLALGKNWRQLDNEQRVKFVEEFRLLLIRTYSTAMLEYTNEEIRLLPFRDDVSRKRVTVPMEVVQPAGPPIPMSLALYENDDNAWKVYDVKIDGVSLVTNYRSSFATQIRNKGVDNLISDLADRNAKLKS